MEDHIQSPIKYHWPQWWMNCSYDWCMSSCIPCSQSCFFLQLQIFWFNDLRSTNMKYQIAGITYWNYFASLFGMMVLMLTFIGERITPLAICHCVFSEVLNFRLFFVGIKWNIGLLHPFLWGNGCSTYRIEQHSCWNVLCALKWDWNQDCRSLTWLWFRLR